MTRALLIYVYTMPVLLWPVVGWASPVISAIVAFIFFGVENVAVQVQCPSPCPPPCPSPCPSPCPPPCPPPCPSPCPCSVHHQRWDSVPRWQPSFRAAASQAERAVPPTVAAQIEEPHRSLDLRGLCVAVQASAEQLRAAASDPDALAAVQHFGAAPPTVVVSNA
eukprot:353572-Chlamydomonas_euryale.AAC.10